VLEIRSSADRPPPPRFIGFFVLLLGVGIIGMGALHPEKARGAWLGFGVGALFALAGLSILLQPAPGAPPGKAAALNSFFGACLFTIFTAILIWWAFYARSGGDRVAIGPIAFSASGRWAWLARAPVAAAAALCGLVTVFVWRAFLDAAEAAFPGSRAALAAAVILALGWGGWKLFRPAPRASFGSPVVEAALTAGFGATGTGAPQVHGTVGSSPEGAAFQEDAGWLDYALPAALHLDGTAALQVEVRAERRRAKRRSPFETFAAAGPYVLDSEPSSDSWRVKASAGSCELTSDPLPYGSWTTVALAYDDWAGRASLFVDGKRIETVPCKGLPAERLDTLRLGTWHEDYQAFTGILRSVRIYARVGDI